MTAFQKALDEKKILIVDGAWGTELSKLGLPNGTAPELWNLENPDAVRAVAASYVDAGVDIILSNTFRGSRCKLAKVDLAEKRVEANRRGVELSREAAGDRALVFASMGPTGEFMAPLGLISETEMIDTFAEQAAALIAGGADGIVIETMSDLGEAKAALKGARNATDLPVVVSMTYDKTAAGFATMMGVTPTQAATELDKAGADVIGTNCGSGIENVIEIVTQLRSATDRPIWAKPNAGLPELINGETVFRETPEQMACRFPDLAKAGAQILGGCCGTTPKHLSVLTAGRQTLS